MHRAFDRGLLSIDQDYRVIISSGIIEDVQHTYSIKQLAGKQIHLPPSTKYYPAQENIAWHREHVFKG